MPSSNPGAADLTQSLALSIVSTSDTPLLLLDDTLKIIAVSKAFSEAFGLDGRTAVGTAVSSLGNGEWASPQLQSMLKATAAGMAEIKDYEFDLRRDGRESRLLVLSAHKLSYNESSDVRVLLAIADATDSRTAKRVEEGLLREKEILLKELQHRVANSLQIIASVLMQNARKVQSEETRGHLRDAHNRVMSVAALQRQLAASGEDDVDLKPYIAQLCQCIGASMIRDLEQIHLVVTVDGSRVTPDISVSLGLIVTELVINALKHAFPDDRAGTITVDYRSTGSFWALTVTDDGIGMGPTDDPPKSGLGTSIVNALASQLRAEVSIHSGDGGTSVSLVHSQTLGTGAGSKPLPEIPAL